MIMMIVFMVMTVTLMVIVTVILVLFTLVIRVHWKRESEKRAEQCQKGSLKFHGFEAH
ncbi:MAG TPA: hypothetical protein VKO38_06135 [Wenzhouxiangella sp.]|nr:hypothetical protein [Wenzhouxiangella sp.]